MKIIIENWRIAETFQRLDRRVCEVIISDHALNDKNLSPQDLEKAEQAVRCGRLSINKSWKKRNRICLKQYFKDNNTTYFAVTEYYEKSIIIVTVMKKEGRY